jgi:carboxyl-terminal processing protease
MNSIAAHYYNPTPLNLFTPTGRAILSDPHRLRTELTYAAIQGVMSSLDDPYTRFLDPASYKEMQQDNTGSFAGIGAQLSDQDGKILIVKPLPDTPASRAGVMPGDQIIAINGHSTDKLMSEAAVQIIRGNPGTPVVLTIRRGNKVLTVRLIRAIINSQHFDFRMIDGDIGYMRLTQFDEQAADNIEHALQDFSHKGVKGLILDLRDDPGGLLNAAIDVASKFIPPGPVVWVQERAGQRTALVTDDDARSQGHLPLVVLVNHNSASASEIVSGAIKDTHSGTLVGLQTWGKGLVQEVIPLNDNSAIALTTERYYTPSGMDINKKGVAPDVVVGRQVPEPDEITEATIQSWRTAMLAVDKEQLDAGVALLKKQIAAQQSQAVQAPAAIPRGLASATSVLSPGEKPAQPSASRAAATPAGNTRITPAPGPGRQTSPSDR